MLCKKSSDNTSNKRRVFGRRLGRPLNQARAKVIDTLLPALAIGDDVLQENGTLSPATLFNTPYKECWFEIGFGSGEHLSALMRRNPENAYIGAEPFINGMAAFLRDIENDPHDKIRLHMNDAMMVAHSLTDKCLDGIYILNPDPWHKKRHHKRRIVHRENVSQFARILKPGGQLILSTDVPYLADWMITETLIGGRFEWLARSKKDWSEPPKDWTPTAYQAKGAKGADKMVYLFFKKKA